MVCHLHNTHAREEKRESTCRWPCAPIFALPHIPKQDNGISAQAELHPPRSLRVHQVLSRELSHHLATNQRNAASLAPSQNTGWLLSYCDFVFLCTKLSNGKSSQLTLPFLPTPLPLLMNHIAPTPHPHR